MLNKLAGKYEDLTDYFQENKEQWLEKYLKFAEKFSFKNLKTDDYDFDPDILRLQNQSPSPLPRAFLWVLLSLLTCLFLWALFGRLDIIAVAQGKIVPKSSLQIVQPTDSGIVKEILVSEGDEVFAGQIVARMDALFSDADNQTLEDALHIKKLQLQRIDAELAGKPLVAPPNIPARLFQQVKAQYESHLRAYHDALDTANSVKLKSMQDLEGALERTSTLKQTIPIYIEQDKAYQKLAKEGYVSSIIARDKSRARIEVEQELQVQNHTVESLRATITQSENHIAQVVSNYRQDLLNERIAAEGEFLKLEQDIKKQVHRHALLELRAPQNGIVKDIATHTPRTVVSPGSILMTVVPKDDTMEAEVLVSHIDAGFIHAKQHARVKLTAYSFQKYGMVEGEVRNVSPDAVETEENQMTGIQGYKTTIALFTNELESGGKKYKLTPGMQVSAEIHLGTRSIWEYLLSPVRGTVQEAGRER